MEEQYTMGSRNALMTAALLALMVTIAQVAAQQPPPAPPPASPQGGGPGGPPAPAPAGPGPGRQGGRATFPAGQRPPDDPAVVARGKAIYEMLCQACHGRDLRGGEQGGPNLLRSATVLEDQMGELIVPIVRNGQGKMLPLPIPEEDAKATAIFIHSVAATMQGQGGPPRGNPIPPPEAVLVGNVEAGRAYFTAKCSACHSVTGDLRGVGGRFQDPRLLQANWVAGGASGGRGGRGGVAGAPRPVTVTVTLPSGQKVSGRLGRVDDFVVVMIMDDGTQRSFARNGDVPKVEVKDPLQPHYDLLPTLTDKDMHDVTAYLATIK